MRTRAFKNWFGDWEHNPEDASKIIDGNGEPLVVYHQTNAKVYINRETGENWDELDWQARDEWENRDDWEDYWKEQDFYSFTRINARQSIEMPAFFFSPENDIYHEYGDRTIDAFLNIRRPTINPHIKDAGVTNTAGLDAMNELIARGHGYAESRTDPVRPADLGERFGSRARLDTHQLSAGTEQESNTASAMKHLIAFGKQ